MKAGRRTTQMPPVTNALSPRFQDALIGTQPNLRPALELNDMALTFQQASQNATLEEIFFYACALFPAAYALTIEGGQGKRSPMVQPFRDPWNPNHPHKSRQVIFTDGRSYLKERLPKLPIHPNIGTLVLKGAWNIIRQPSDFDTIVEALPNLREWHCLYAKPKTEAYKTLCMLIRSPPPTIHHLNICLDGLCGKPSSFPEKWRSVYDSHHLCVELGTLAPNLESISFTGRICGSLFKTAVASALRMRDPPNLKSVDLIVRNCCRSSSLWNDGTGIYNLDFIAAFTRLVIEAIRSLRTFTKLNFLRIRFIDLDSPNPLLNPYFQMQGNTVMGIWNEEILSTVKEARPDARFEGLEYYEQGWGSREMVGERAMGGGRPKSICVDTYSLLLDSS